MSVEPDETAALQGGLSTTPTGRRVPAGIVRVNLVPAEIAEAKAVKLTAVAMAGTAVLALGAVGFLYHQQTAKVGTAKSELASAQQTNTQLTAEQGRLGNVDALYAKVDAAQAMLTSAETPQVLWSRYLEDLRLQLPEHTWLTTMSATETGATAAAATATAPAAAATAATSSGATTSSASAAATHPGTGAATATTDTAIGTLNFAGSSYTHNDVADWLDRLASLHGVSSPYLASSTETLAGTGSTAVPTVNWSLTASLTGAALKSSYTSANGAVTP